LTVGYDSLVVTPYSDEPLSNDPVRRAAVLKQRAAAAEARRRAPGVPRPEVRVWWARLTLMSDCQHYGW
jgi:hypothetical protein